MSVPITRPLGDVAAFVRGITFKPEDVVPVGTPGSAACMRTKNVQAELDLSDVWGIPESFVRRNDQYLIPGDTLVSSANSWNLVGKCCWVPNLPWPSTFGGFISILRADRDKIDQRYLFRWFASGRTQATVRSLGQQTTNISNLNVERCLRLPIPLPPLHEQRRIAEILDKADALRAKRRDAMAEVDTFTQSIFFDMFGDPATNPKDWPIVSLEQIVSDTKLGLVRGSNDVGPDFPFPYVRMNAITRSGELDLTDTFFTHATDAEVANYRLAPGDFLFNTRNSEELVGKTALYCGNELHLFNNNLMRIRFGPSAEPEFVAVAFKTGFVQHELNLRKSGTTNVFAIYYKDLRSLRFPLPPIELQRVFRRRVGAVKKLKAAQHAAEARLDALFASLEHRAFRGKL